MMAVMDSAIIVAIIGGAATVVAAFVSVKRGQNALRDESSSQHGVLADLIKSLTVQSDNIYDDLQEVKSNLKDHLVSHDTADAKPATPTRSAAKPKKAAKKAS